VVGAVLIRIIWDKEEGAGEGDKSYPEGMHRFAKAAYSNCQKTTQEEGSVLNSPTDGTLLLKTNEGKRLGRTSLQDREDLEGGEPPRQHGDREGGEKKACA